MLRIIVDHCFVAILRYAVRAENVRLFKGRYKNSSGLPDLYDIWRWQVAAIYDWGPKCDAMTCTIIGLSIYSTSLLFFIIRFIWRHGSVLGHTDQAVTTVYPLQLRALFYIYVKKLMYFSELSNFKDLS